MFYIDEITFLILFNIIYAVLGFHVYVLDEEVTAFDPNQDLTEAAIQEAMTIPGQGSVPDADIFHYENAQQNGLSKTKERCYDDHVHCYTSLISLARPVCAYNKLIPSENRQCNNGNYYRCSKRTFNSVCDAYLDNCRRGYRFWRTIDYGVCSFNGVKTFHQFGTEWFNVKMS